MKIMISRNKHSVAHFISFAYLVVSVSVALFTLLKIFLLLLLFFLVFSAGVTRTCLFLN